MPQSFNTWQMIGLIVASGMLWLHYVWSKDRLQPEPRWRLLLAFVLGMFAWGLSLLGYLALEGLGVPGVKFHEQTWTAIYCFGIIGPLEEGAKVLVAWLIVFRWREFDEPLDGFVYAAAISLGFASMENLYTTHKSDWLHQLASTAALPITHVLFGAIWGFGLGHARFCVSTPSKRVLWQIFSILLAMWVHGFYDFVLFAYQATLVTSGVALALWTIIIWRTHRLARISKRPQPRQG